MKARSFSGGLPRQASRGDIAWVAAGTLLTFALGCGFEWQERLAAWSHRFERWQVDELPLTLMALSLGLAWYAWRRRAESAGLLAHNRELARRLIEVQESERRALARELHDELAQHCTAIRVEAAYLQRCRDTAEISAAAQRAAETAGLLQQGVRRMLRRLRPAELDELGLVAALQALVAGWRERSSIGCSLRVEGRLEGLGEAVDTGVYRVVQEAFANVMRHAAATQVRVELSGGASALVLRVVDDGRGFDPSTATRGLGLLGACERAALLGGGLTVDSAPGSGTRLRMDLPLARAPAASHGSPVAVPGVARPDVSMPGIATPEVRNARRIAA